MMADQIQHQNEVPHVEYIVCLCGFFPSHHIIFTKHKASHIFRIYSVANRCTDWEKGAGLFRNNETCYESFWIMSAIFWRILCKIRKMIQPKSSPIPHHTHTLVSYKLLSVIVATPFLALAETYSSFFSISSNLYLYVKVKALLWTACVRMCGCDIVLSFNFDTLHLEFHFSFLILRKVVLLNRYNDKLNKMVLAKERERKMSRFLWIWQANNGNLATKTTLYSIHPTPTSYQSRHHHPPPLPMLSLPLRFSFIFSPFAIVM